MVIFFCVSETSWNSVFMREMRKEGLEPPYPFGYQILSLARLPVPPLSRQCSLIWNDLSSQLHLRTNSKAASKAVEAAIATVDHSDIRGSEPHNRDPSGATSD